MIKQYHSYLLTLLAGMLAFAGCAETSAPSDAASIGAAIELENGGLDMEDEAPAFGDAAAFEDAGVLDAYAEVDDPTDRDPEVDAMRERPDAAQVNMIVEWGQIPGNPENEVARDWSGAFFVNRGALIVRRVVRFEDRTDHLLERPDRQTVPFTSVTKPHHDGMILTIIDPDPFADEPLTFNYATRRDDGSLRPDTLVTVTVRELLDGRAELISDDAGNRMVAAAMARPLDVCENGFLAGKWHQVEENRGRILGRVANSEGEPVGHIRGVYGKRRDGSQVFFGKYINLDGEFKGIFRGEYGSGRFLGRWIHRAGEHGVLGGAYREDAPGDRVGGHFVGRWAETSCNLQL